MLQTMKQRYKNNNNSATCTSSYKQLEEEEEIKVNVKVKHEEEEEEEEEDKLEVAEILLELHHLIPKYDTSPPLLSWGVKRKRSALDSNPSSPLLPSSQSSPLLLHLPLPSIHHHHHHPVVFVEKREREREEEPKKIEFTSRRSSPATPLSFSPSESDSIRKPYKRKLVSNSNKKKTKEEWQTDVITLADQQDTLKKELRKVMDYYENLKTKNLELKFTLQKIKSHFHQNDLSANLKSCNGKSLDLCLEQANPVLPSISTSVPPEQVIEKTEPMVVYQQTDITERRQKKKFIRSGELLENSRYSYNHQTMPPPPPPPPPASHLQSGVGVGVGIGIGIGIGFGGMGQNVSPHGLLLPDLNITDASSTTAVAATATADETSSSSNNNGIEHPNPNNYTIQHLYQQQQQHWYESSSNNRAAAEARRRRMEEMRKGKRSMDSIKTRCR